MTREDYSKYYIQGSDHYLIPKDIFDELITEMENWKKEAHQYKEVIDKAIEYINEYAWKEDIIGDIYTVTGKPMVDKYMQLEWDNCKELLGILSEVE